MDKLTDPNPYEILNIKPDSNRKTIKRALADRQRENKTQAERQQALQARNALFSIEKRLITDALTPTSLMPDSVRDSDLKLSDSRHRVDWRDIADPDEILQDAVSALIAATIWHTRGDVQEPDTHIDILTDFDGLDEFITEWLNQ